jgi:hypothetical protein
MQKGRRGYALADDGARRRRKSMIQSVKQQLGGWRGIGALALAAIIVLPLLEARGYRPGGPNPQAALDMLTFTYAVLPCFLKLAAVAMVARLPRQEVVA